METTFEAFRQLAHPERARVLVHLHEHPGDTPELVSEHLQMPASTAYRFLSDLELAGFVRGTDTGGVRHFEIVPFGLTINVQILKQMLEAPYDLAFVYRQRLGATGWNRLRQAAGRAREGELTIRQAAKRSGLPYREFTSLYEAIAPPIARAKEAARR